jgi:hypothetical protein
MLSRYRGTTSRSRTRKKRNRSYDGDVLRYRLRTWKLRKRSVCVRETLYHDAQDMRLFCILSIDNVVVFIFFGSVWCRLVYPCERELVLQLCWSSKTIDLRWSWHMVVGRLDENSSWRYKGWKRTVSVYGHVKKNIKVGSILGHNIQQHLVFIYQLLFLCRRTDFSIYL